MALPKSPFSISTATPGVGEIVLDVSPPDKQVLKTFTYQYPLKLIAPDTHVAPVEKHVTVVFLLTYGGGLVGGDQIDLTATINEGTRLALLTQGSTKIFKSPTTAVVSRQVLNVKIGRHAALCYLPDPTQPFAESVYEQRQTFYVEPDGSSSALVLDWVTEGRKARGESWTLWSWKGRNEFREFEETSRGRLLLRDAVMLDEQTSEPSLASKTDNMGIYGTLIIYGSMFLQLRDFILKEFANQPRLGGRTWTATSHSSMDTTAATNKTQAETEIERRTRIETEDGLVWTAAQVRGFVLVKFSANQLDGARRWLSDLLRREGTVEKQFGHQALLCLR